MLNFIELHYDTGDAIIINVNKIVSYARVPGRNYTERLNVLGWIFVSKPVALRKVPVSMEV